MEAPVPAPAAPGQKTNGLALAAGILGICGIAASLLGFLLNAILPGFASVCGCGLGLLAAVVGLILGFVSQAQIKNHPGEKGKGMAVTGIVIGIVGLVTACLLPVLVLVGGTAVIALLGPTIGNVFSEISTQLPPDIFSTPVP